MSNLEVKTVIASIIAAFSSGIEVLRRVRDNRPITRATESTSTSKEELRLAKSLHRGSRAISREYERDYSELGQSFATGDVVAQASLAETLLRLNTGLVNIISAFLAGDRDRAQLDLRSLTDLSDSSRRDALNALGQLYTRLSKTTRASQESSIEGVRSRSTDHLENLDASMRKMSNKESSKVPITGGILPSLVYSLGSTTKPSPKKKGGAWVRPRRSSVSSSVGIAPADIKPTHAPVHAIAGAPDPIQNTSASAPAKCDTAGLNSLPRPASRRPPPIPTKPIALRSPSPMCLLKATPSVCSFGSDSTKLGEIPQHKWATPAYSQSLEAKEPLITAALGDGYISGEGVRGKTKSKTRFLQLFSRTTALKVEQIPTR